MTSGRTAPTASRAPRSSTSVAKQRSRSGDVVARGGGGGRDVADAERRDGIGAALLVRRDEQDAHAHSSRSAARVVRTRSRSPPGSDADAAGADARSPSAPARGRRAPAIASRSPPPDISRTNAVRASRSVGRVGRGCGAPARSTSRDRRCGRRRSRGSGGSARRRRGRRPRSRRAPPPRRRAVAQDARRRRARRGSPARHARCTPVEKTGSMKHAASPAMR